MPICQGQGGVVGKGGGSVLQGAPASLVTGWAGGGGREREEGGR